MDYSEEYSVDDNITSVPAPLIDVYILNCYIKDLLTQDKFLIDSGSDISVIREQIFNVLDLEIFDEVDISTINNINGEIKKYPTCFVNMEIPQIGIIKKVEVAIQVQKNNEENLLGRDFLEFISVFLDGPNQSFKLINLK